MTNCIDSKKLVEAWKNFKPSMPLSWILASFRARPWRVNLGRSRQLPESVSDKDFETMEQFRTKTVEDHTKWYLDAMEALHKLEKCTSALQLSLWASECIRSAEGDPDEPDSYY